jgi:hypothetical protein
VISKPEWNFVFVAVSKTGSSSIRHRLVKLGAAEPGGKDGFSFIDYKHAQHYNIQEYRQILGDELDDRFKFAFVRNPWSRLVSNFTMLTRGKVTTIPRDWRGDPARFQQWIKKVLDPEYVAKDFCIRGKLCTHERSTLIPQLDWLVDADGNLDVDFIGRFENIRADFHTVLTRIDKVRPLPDKKRFWTLPHHNSTNNKQHYSEYYDDKTRELVGKVFKRDIDYFGYTYEKGPGS